MSTHGSHRRGTRATPARHLAREREQLPAARLPARPHEPVVPGDVGLLEDAGARRRVRGLSLLAEIEEPDLFDWCAMLLDDEAVSVRLAALRTMLLCEDGDPEVIAPLAGSGERRVRAAAIAALARHSGEDAGRWVARGLKDPCPCVRVAASMELARVDPTGHHGLFELALYDHNREVARRARRRVRGKGFAKVRW